MGYNKFLLAAGGLGLATCALAQATAPAAQSTAPQAVPTATVVADATPATPKVTYTVPSGTKVLLSLRSAVNTKTAKPGDGVYLVSNFPVVVNNRVLIPSGVYVQGVVDRVIRPGHVKGRAQLDMHFTSMIFPNGTVVEIPGVVNSLPGSEGAKVKDGEGGIEQSSGKGRDVANAAKLGAEGAMIGAVAGGINGSPGQGAAIGGGAGAAVGLVTSLFTRGDDINIQSGTPVEMVLQRPLSLEADNLAATAPEAGPQPNLSPSTQQGKPLDKPKPSAHMMCPAGTPGCS